MFKKTSAYEKLELARKVERTSGRCYIENMFSDFFETHGDRQCGDDKSIITGIAYLEDIPVTVIAQQKGKSTEEYIKSNFGMTSPEGFRKSLRAMKQAEKFNRPIICIVDTPGAFCGVEAEERGQGEAIGKNILEMFGLTVPIISIIIGEGGSGGALALAVANEVWILENAIYSILSPEGFASILWKDAKRSKEACEVMKITSEDLLKLKVVDRIVKEPSGGVQENEKMVYTKLKKDLVGVLSEYMSLSKEELLNRRYDRYRNFENDVI